MSQATKMQSVWAFGLIALTGKPCGKPLTPKSPKKVAQTCLDHLRAGKKECGVYSVYDAAGNHYPVYCDMKSEPGNAWTLVMSFSFKERLHFQKKGFPTNFPVNENSPNWSLYRLTKARMSVIKSHSTHWRSTCSFPEAGVDYRDYVRGSFKDFDIMTFVNDVGVCMKVELINVRGHYGIHVTSRWWQNPTNFFLHLGSHQPKPCQFNAKAGSVINEANFGYYGSDANVNKKFRCSENDKSSTNWWFGGHL